MPRLSRRQRHLHGLRIPHFSHDDDIGRLANRRAQRGREIRGVNADLHLFDEASLVRVLLLERIFNRDDVLMIATIDQIDERGHRGALARSCWSANEHETVGEPRERLDASR